MAKKEELGENRFKIKQVQSRQIDLRKVNFIARIDTFGDEVHFTVKVTGEELVLIMGKEDWDYVYMQIKRANMRRVQSKRYAMKAKRFQRKKVTESGKKHHGKGNKRAGRPPTKKKRTK